MLNEYSKMLLDSAKAVNRNGGKYWKFIMAFQDDTKKFNDMLKYRVICKCSHSILIPKADRTICSHCGRWVYRTPQIEFKYKIKGFLIKEEKNDNQIRQTSKTSNSKSD